MNIYNLSIDNNFVMDKPIVGCIGYFDGLHLGHQILIKETIKQAQQIHVESCLISFTPDPWLVINHLDNTKHINTFDQRLEIIESLGIDNVIFVDFTLEVAHLTPEIFLFKILYRCNLKMLVCGFDFHYGYRGKGNIDTLINDSKDLFTIVEVDKVIYLNEKVSSTRIIKEINNGNVELVNKLLNYDYFIESRVIKGRQKGRTIGYPTCNLEENKEIVVMKNGIYIGFVNYKGKIYKAMINIGHNPTFNYIESNSIEVHILDFTKEIYGEKIKLIFKKYICDEKKYDNINDLKNALKKYAKLALEQKDLVI
jgi:riboflavin kinase/FMN adenylyltransferase